ncbi:s-adenosylmethionine decarboxylase proenzyme [Moniliophthora roreri MCA 2997]|uniref:adenosylmethionine decarboxylase n=1 Tax=Moniliophthora roreri (strain MCA 2997) TaxID=1381753 RepID=V2XGS1_MONRO|nr:s-adenosylmethionine decarboxylase proenzyme [Moniliophthora roreri MCA 2997]
MSAAPFEGPEKLLEIWFAPSADAVPDAASPVHGRTGLRKIPSSVWDDMLSIVRCKVLSVITGTEIDAYLLSESSLFISPHRLILKTCGTTLNLLGLPRILEIAATQANMSTVYRCFYSRKSFMFPELQPGPHRDWSQEIQFLDGIFQNGAAYTVGKVNGDHWLLYITGKCSEPSYSVAVPSATSLAAPGGAFPDFTIEILMSDLSPKICEPFSSFDPSSDATPAAHAHELSASLGITDIFPAHLTTLDAYSFTPCGYSSNALIRWGEDPSFVPSGAIINGVGHPGEGYYTIHVTPESGWSYASFECNVPLPTTYSSSSDDQRMPDLKTLVQRVVSIFRPSRLSLTLFISSEDNEVDEDGEGAEEVAQKVFRAALSVPFEEEERDKRTDKINYEFGGYDLAFASFELYDHLS